MNITQEKLKIDLAPGKHTVSFFLQKNVSAKIKAY